MFSAFSFADAEHPAGDCRLRDKMSAHCLAILKRPHGLDAEFTEALEKVAGTGA